MGKTRFILNEIKKHYGFKKDADFAKFLEITPQTLYNWKLRNSMNYTNVYTKCIDIDPHWLLLGEGQMLKSSGKDAEKDLKGKRNVQEGCGVTLTDPSCILCSYKDRIIEQQRISLEIMTELNNLLKTKLEEKSG